MGEEKSVGKILKDARIAKNLSLGQVERETSIRALYLEAVENDNYTNTPGEVFVKGIIRTYGNFLGLNGPELVNLYKTINEGLSKQELESRGIREVDKVELNIQLKDKRDIGSGTGKFSLEDLPLKQIATGTVVLLLLGAGYFAVPMAVDMAKGLPLPTSRPAATEPAAPVKPAVLDKVLVEMEVLDDRCWLEVSGDGKELASEMIYAGDKRTFEAKDKLVIKFGNIGVMRLRVNGQDVDLKGEQGVAVKTYFRNKIE